MTIREYLETKEVKPKELKDNFTLVREFDLDIFNHEGCYNCGDLRNNERLRVGSWLHGQFCRKCNSIIMVYEQDRMGGAFTDVIEVYQEKV